MGVNMSLFRDPRRAIKRMLQREPDAAATGPGVLTRVKSYCATAGTRVLYAALLLYFAYRQSDTPGWAKRIVLGAFAYLLTPLDALPDLTPLLGFTDDFGVLMFGLVSIAGYVNEEVRVEARQLLSQWVGRVDPADLEVVDKKL